VVVIVGLLHRKGKNAIKKLKLTTAPNPTTNPNPTKEVK